TDSAAICCARAAQAASSGKLLSCPPHCGHTPSGASAAVPHQVHSAPNTIWSVIVGTPVVGEGHRGLLLVVLFVGGGPARADVVGVATASAHVRHGCGQVE